MAVPSRRFRRLNEAVPVRRTGIFLKPLEVGLGGIRRV